MIRLSDQQADKLAGLFEQLDEVFTLMNTFLDDQSGGKAKPDQVADLRRQSASVMETAAEVADMLAQRSKQTKGNRPWSNYGGGAKFGSAGSPGAGGAARKTHTGSKTTPSGS